VLKTCARVKFFSTIIFGKCSVTGANFLCKFPQKMMEIAIIFRGQLAIFTPKFWAIVAASMSSHHLVTCTLARLLCEA
jgi:hypothetical protein